jgi:hypothetical protein
MRYGLIALLGLGIPLILVITQTGTTRIRCDRQPTGAVCQEERTLFYGWVHHPMRILWVEDVRFEERVRSATDGDRTYRIYTVYLDTDQGEVVYETSRNRAIAEQQYAEVQTLLQGTTSTITHTQGDAERAIVATVVAAGMAVGAVILLTRA